MTDVSSLESIPDLLKLLANGIRQEILVILANGEKDVTFLTAELGRHKGTISNHLGLLFTHQIVEYERVKDRHVYRIGRRVLVERHQDVCAFQVSGANRSRIDLQLPTDPDQLRQALFRPMRLGRASRLGD